MALEKFVTTRRRLRRSQWRHCSDIFGRRPPKTEKYGTYMSSVNHRGKYAATEKLYFLSQLVKSLALL